MRLICGLCLELFHRAGCASFCTLDCWESDFRRRKGIANLEPEVLLLRSKTFDLLCKGKGRCGEKGCPNWGLAITGILRNPPPRWPQGNQKWKQGLIRCGFVKVPAGISCYPKGGSPAEVSRFDSCGSGCSERLHLRRTFLNNIITVVTIHHWRDVRSATKNRPFMNCTTILMAFPRKRAIVVSQKGSFEQFGRKPDPPTPEFHSTLNLARSILQTWILNR